MVKNEPVEQAITEKSVSSNNEIAKIKDLKDIRKKLFHRFQNTCILISRTYLYMSDKCFQYDSPKNE